MSPTSAADVLLDIGGPTGPQPDDLPLWKRSQKSSPATCSNVANLIGLHSVTPCSIVYVAVQVVLLWKWLGILTYDFLWQLCFALSSAPSWNIVDIDFKYEDFYNSIIDYFKVTPGLATKACVDDLLAWWNQYVYSWSTLCSTNAGPRKVFGHCKYGASYLAVACVGTSVARLSEHRQARESQAQAAMQWLVL